MQSSILVSKKNTLICGNQQRNGSSFKMNSSELVQYQITKKLKELCDKRKMRFVKILCQGSFVNVYLCIYKGAEVEVEIKVIAIKQSNEVKLKDIQEKLRIENKLSFNIHHKHIIKTYFIELSKENDTFFQIKGCERAKNRSLADLTYAVNMKNFLGFTNFNENIKHIFYISESFVKFFMYQIALGLHYLNENELVHLDIKPENILLARHFITKIIDFSLVGEVNHDDCKYYIRKTGTLAYLPPNFYRKGKLFKFNQVSKVDIYSIGVMMYLMFFKENLVKQEKNVDYKIWIEILRKAKEKIKETFILGNKCKFLMIKLLSPEEKDRLNIFELLEHVWFKDIKDIDFMQEVFNSEDYKLLVELQKCDRCFRKRNIRKRFNTIKKIKLGINRKYLFN